MRASWAVVAMMLVGLSGPASAECFGSYPDVVCISKSGRVWISQDGYGRSSYPPRKPGIARFPNASAGRPDSKPAASADTSGETTVLQPSAQTGNAWVLTPQTSEGATLLNGPRSPGGCGSGAICP